MPEFNILVEGLDAISLGDVYKAAFPKGVLHSIREQYLHSPSVEDGDVVIVKPETVNEKEDTDYTSKNDIEYDEVLDDNAESNIEDLKEEPITDDYVYDQPIEDRFSGEREYVTRDDEETKIEDNRGSKTVEHSLKAEVIDEGKRNKELSKYGARFRDWLTIFFTG